MTQLTNDSTQNIDICKQAILACFVNYPILQQLTLCQAILEAGLQRSPPSQLAIKYNNLFGMKPGSIVPLGTSTPGYVILMTTEYVNGNAERVPSRFLANKDIEDSFKQHEKLLLSLSRYSNLKTAQTFKDAARMIREDGYATDPSYTNLLEEIYNKYLD